MLVYLFLFINYNTYNKTYEKFDVITNPLGLTFEINETDTSGDGDPAVIIPVKKENNGISIQNALKKPTNIVAINDLQTSQSDKLGSGYYWVNLPVIGKKLIFFKVDNTSVITDFWLLAMRGCRNSNRFKYNSKYWTTNSTYNAKSEKILANNYSTNASQITITENGGLIEYNKNTAHKFDISSIGERIFNDLEINSYDAKFDIYNYYKFTEIMIILYGIDNKGNKITETIKFALENTDNRALFPLLQGISKKPLTTPKTSEELTRFNVNINTLLNEKIRMGDMTKDFIRGLGYNEKGAGLKNNNGFIQCAFELYVK